MAPGPGNGDPSWAWLGLLKWSLSYTDGTTDTDVTAMSEEDKKFLESVMKDGILDENERMKVILSKLTDALEIFKALSEGKDEEQAQTKDPQPDNDDELEDLLWELRDIVEQIDYARAFAAMKGLPFLLGCVQERKAVPKFFRLACLGILATLCQNNPPVQLELLELGSIAKLSQLYFDETQDDTADADGAIRAKIVQALSANVRSHAVAEQVFCVVDQAPTLIASALGASPSNESAPTAPSDALRKRALFFLRALVTSDTSTAQRVRLFSVSVGFVADELLALPSAEIREWSVELLLVLLEQKKSVDVILDRKDRLASMGVERIAALRALTGDDRQGAQKELETWESLLVQLARAERDETIEESASAPSLLIGTGPTNLEEPRPLAQ